jgi:hypothetical protein
MTWFVVVLLTVVLIWNLSVEKLADALVVIAALTGLLLIVLFGGVS